MAGAVDALGLGAAVFGQDEVVQSCCLTFATLAGRDVGQIIGSPLAQLVPRRDHRAARWLVSSLWATGGAFTFLTRHTRSDGAARIVESRVMRLVGSQHPLAVVLAREFTCENGAPRSRLDVGVAEYVADMASQLSAIASRSAMPVTCDLLTVSARAARLEAALPAPAPA